MNSFIEHGPEKKKLNKKMEKFTFWGGGGGQGQFEKNLHFDFFLHPFLTICVVSEHELYTMMEIV